MVFFCSVNNSINTRYEVDKCLANGFNADTVRIPPTNWLIVDSYTPHTNYIWYINRYTGGGLDWTGESRTQNTFAALKFRNYSSLVGSFRFHFQFITSSEAFLPGHACWRWRFQVFEFRLPRPLGPPAPFGPAQHVLFCFRLLLFCVLANLTTHVCNTTAAFVRELSRSSRVSLRKSLNSPLSFCRFSSESLSVSNCGKTSGARALLQREKRGKLICIALLLVFYFNRYLFFLSV